MKKDINEIEKAIVALEMNLALMLFDPTTGESIALDMLNNDNQELYKATQLALLALSEKANHTYSKRIDKPSAHNTKSEVSINADCIKNMSNKELAVLLCYCTSEPSYDEGMDGEWQQIGYNDVWQSTVLTGYFDSYEDVYEAVLKWLNSNREK